MGIAIVVLETVNGTQARYLQALGCCICDNRNDTVRGTSQHVRKLQSLKEASGTVNTMPQKSNGGSGGQWGAEWAFHLDDYKHQTGNKVCSPKIWESQTRLGNKADIE